MAAGTAVIFNFPFTLPSPTVILRRRVPFLAGNSTAVTPLNTFFRRHRRRHYSSSFPVLNAAEIPNQCRRTKFKCIVSPYDLKLLTYSRRCCHQFFSTISVIVFTLVFFSIRLQVRAFNANQIIFLLILFLMLLCLHHSLLPVTGQSMFNQPFIRKTAARQGRACRLECSFLVSLFIDWNAQSIREQQLRIIKMMHSSKSWTYMIINTEDIYAIRI